MTGPEHYREAEKLLGNIRIAIAADGPEAEGGIPEWTAIAQVHATLALAAVTAEATAGRVVVLDPDGPSLRPYGAPS